MFVKKHGKLIWRIWDEYRYRCNIDLRYPYI